MDAFFLSWALWEQMTFVLAMCIVIVFCLGLIKLWWASRLSKKQEVLDQEKRARLQEMRKVGLAAKKTTEIPFGIRAIQSGIEVDGIWISRTPTPSTDLTGRMRAASSATIRSPDSENGSLRAKGRVVVDDSRMSASTVDYSRTSPRLSPSEASTFDRNVGSEVFEASPPLTPLFMQYMKGKPHLPHHPRVGTLLNEDTLRRLEGQGAVRTAFDTYIPTPPYGAPQQTTPREVKRPAHRGSGSSSDSVSSASSHQSQSRSLTSSQGNDPGTTRDPTPYSTRRAHEGRVGYSTIPPASPEKESRNSFDTPRQTPTLELAGLKPARRREALATPEPTFGPGDIHINRSVRKVNSGFEVLPAGTFSFASESQESNSNVDLEKGMGSINDGVAEHRGFARGVSNKLRKKSPPRPDK